MDRSTCRIVEQQLRASDPGNINRLPVARYSRTDQLWSARSAQKMRRWARPLNVLSEELGGEVQGQKQRGVTEERDRDAQRGVVASVWLQRCVLIWVGSIHRNLSSLIL